MRLTRRRRATRPDMNMTPMIDIVFLLIIFFMTVSQISEVNRERLELPQLAGSEDQRPTIMTVNFDEAGRMIVAGEAVSMDQLVAYVDRELRGVNDDPGRLSIVLRADRRGTTGPVNEAVTRLARMGITRVNVAVQVPD